MFSLAPMSEELARSLGQQQDVAGQPLASPAQTALDQSATWPVWAILDGQQVVGAVAAVEVWEDSSKVAILAVFAANARGHALALTRELRRALAGMEYARMETYVDAKQSAASRWARLLGFELEFPDPLPGLLTNGNDAFMFVRAGKWKHAPVDGVAPSKYLV